MVDSSVLWQYSLFNGLEQDQINYLLPLMEQEVYDAGAVILDEGSSNDKIFFIVEGRVSVVKNGVLLEQLDEGKFFGEMEVLEVLPASAAIKALSTTRFLTLSIDTLGEIFETDLKIYSFIIMNLARDISPGQRHLSSAKQDIV